MCKPKDPDCNIKRANDPDATRHRKADRKFCRGCPHDPLLGLPSPRFKGAVDPPDSGEIYPPVSPAFAAPAPILSRAQTAQQLNIMDAKEVATDNTPPSFNEKVGNPPQEHIDDTTTRRQSVAGNIVHNPLARASREATVADARAFAESNGMSEEAGLFGRAALVARDPSKFEALTELEDDERAALIYERDHKWHGSKMLWYSISLCAIGAATQGWDQTGSNGANLSFPDEFEINKTAKDEWIVGLINSIIFLTAGLM